MPFTQTMPKLSPTMEEGTIVKWHAKEGDRIEAGQLLLEVATDKATVEYNALDEGYLRKILIGEEGEAIVNQPIAVMTETADESIEGYAPEGEVVAPEPEVEVAVVAETEAPSKPAAAPPAMGQPAFVPEKPLEGYAFPFPSGERDDRIVASPLAKKIAEEKNLDLTTVQGSGPKGRIISEDLERAQSKGIVTFGERRLPTTPPGSYEEEKLTPMRKAIARRLQESKSHIPHFYARQEINAEPLVAMRAQLREGEIKVTYNDFVIRASALALREHPQLNSGFNTVDQTVVRFSTIDVAVAVSTPGGLITPILRHADYMNLGEISQEIRSLARRAKEGKLEEHEYKGGSFTISNMGMFGTTDFAAIINPPQAAIVAVGGILDVPVVKNKAVVPGKIMNLTVSIDHRVVDGVEGAQFLRTLKRLLENPALLIV